MRGGPPYVYVAPGLFGNVPPGEFTNDFHQLQQQILWQLLASPTVFSVAGNTVAEEHENLHDHVMTRQQIVQNALDKKCKFGIPESFNHTISPAPVYDSDPQSFYDSVNNSQTSCACLRASRMVFYGGIGNFDDWNTQDHNDVWIPGDWGYIDNATNPDELTPAQDGWGAGLEGENIIYLGIGADGNPMFWGHFGQGNTYPTLPEWFQEIESWPNSNGLVGKPVLDSRVDRPTIGFD